MKLETPLFEGEHICLAPIDYEKDPEVESKWTHDISYLRLLSSEPARPLSPEQVKKKYEGIEKDQEERRNVFYFTIRMRPDERLIGFIRLHWIEWVNACGSIQLGIGDPNDRKHGHGSEALRLMLRYAFDELNLFRLTASIPEYNEVAIHLFRKAGFVEEVRRRQAIQRDGRRWDKIILGLLRPEWEASYGS